MAHRTRAVFHALLVAVLASTVPAVAQGPTPGPQPMAAVTVQDAARAAFEDGVAALDESRFADAAAHLAESLALREAPAARYNHVLALRGAGRYREAIASAQRYLEQASDPRHERYRATVAELLPTLEASLARLTLVVTGGATRVFIDGAEFAQADGRWEVPRDPGPIRIVAQRPGHGPVRRSLTLAAGEQTELTLDVAARPLPALIELEVVPAQARVEVNGLAVTGRRLRLTAARTHRLRVQAEGYGTIERELVLAPGERTRLTVSLPERAGQAVTSTWWFWSLAAVGVGAITAGVVAAAGAGSSPVDGDLAFVQTVLRP